MLHLCVTGVQIVDYASARVGFESLQYEAAESSNLDVCIVVNGSLIYSFDLLVTTHAATASESNYCPCTHAFTFTSIVNILS